MKPKSETSTFAKGGYISNSAYPVFGGRDEKEVIDKSPRHIETRVVLITADYGADSGLSKRLDHIVKEGIKRNGGKV